MEGKKVDFQGLPFGESVLFKVYQAFEAHQTARAMIPQILYGHRYHVQPVRQAEFMAKPVVVDSDDVFDRSAVGVKDLPEIIQQAERLFLANLTDLKNAQEKLFGRQEKPKRRRAVLKARQSVQRSLDINLLPNPPRNVCMGTQNRF